MVILGGSEAGNVAGLKAGRLWYVGWTNSNNERWLTLLLQYRQHIAGSTQNYEDDDI